MWSRRCRSSSPSCCSSTAISASSVEAAGARDGVPAAPVRRQGPRPQREQPPSTPLLAAITPGLDPARRVRWLRAALVVVAPRVLHGRGELARRGRRALRGHGGRDPADPRRPSLRAHAAGNHPRRYLSDPQLCPVHAACAGVTRSTPCGTRSTAGSRSRSWPRSSPAGQSSGPQRVRAAFPVAPTVEVEEAGLRAALAWLAFPSVLITVSTGTTDIVLAAMLAIAVLLWRRPHCARECWPPPAGSSSRRLRSCRCRWRRCAAAGSPGPSRRSRLCRCRWSRLLLALGGLNGPQEMIHSVSYQFTRGSEQSLWSSLGIDGVQPLAEGCVLGLIAAAVVRLRLEPTLANDRTRMAALIAAILIGLQTGRLLGVPLPRLDRPAGLRRAAADRGSAAEPAGVPRHR